MDNLILTEIAVAGAMIVGATILGYFLQKGCGIVLIAGTAALAAGLCLAGTAIGGWIGLLIAMLVVGLLGAFAGKKLGEGRGAKLISLMWLGFCLSCLLGYWSGGRIGLLAITLPATLLFWASLYRFSGFLLPLRDSSQHSQAFQSLLTFSLGTNYPYYVMKDRLLEKRVEGTPYKSFLAGPGIVITGCDHIAVVTDGSNLKLPEEPSLTFTHRFETIHRVIDLRPQLRAIPVDARTLDGIRLRVMIFFPFRIHRGGQKPELGRPFPFQRRAVFQAVTGEVVEQEQDQKRNWDDLVEIHATRIMRDVVSRYRFDELCLAMGPRLDNNLPDENVVARCASDEIPSPHDSKHDPRYRIRNELVTRLKKEMKEYGIEVMGGGIGNLSPVDEEVANQRIAHWRTRWQNRIRCVQADRDTRRVELVEGARVEVDQVLSLTVAKMLSEGWREGEDLSDALAAATLIASLERMAENPNVKELLADDTRSKLAYLRSLGRPMALPGAPLSGPGE